MSDRVLIEICVASVDDALSAVSSGADRLELNSALSLGGLTPSQGLFAEVRRRVSVPLIAMVRPRPGGFAYSESDFDVMLHDARSFLDGGADGLAFGILYPDGQIDVPRCRLLRELCCGRQAVLHRAFDVTPSPFHALETAINLGFARVMTSGQAESASEGVELIAELRRRAAGRIEVLPAGGINGLTVTEMLRKSGCDQIHASVRTTSLDPSVSARTNVRFNRRESLPEEQFDHTDTQAVQALRAALGAV